jgi:hypothetical protein
VLPPNDSPPKRTVGLQKGSEKVTHQQRSKPRFRVEVPALYWAAGDDCLRALRTRTKDISRTGLYFYGEFDKPLGSTFEFEVQLPAPFGKGAGGLLRGQGKLVRCDALGDERIGFAATIYQYEFRPAAKPKKDG